MNDLHRYPIIVQKYGGATLASPELIKRVAQKIAHRASTGARLVVVVSAMGKTTNELIELAQKVSQRPQLREMDMLLSVGERISMSLLSMALNDLGCSAISLTGSQAGILTDHHHSQADIIDVKAFRIERALQENKIVILAGFQGVSASTKEVTTLGRGGSDISAVAIASYLKADCCEILKDVDAVYSADPKIIPEARALSELNSEAFLEMTLWGAQVLNYRAAEFAQKQNVPLLISSAENTDRPGTVIRSDVKSVAQKILALNSLSRILALRLSHENKTIDDLQLFLSENQIAPVQYLFSEEGSLYVTAPSETITLLEKYAPQQNFYSISGAYSSVSATFAKPCQDTDLTKLFEILIGHEIRPEKHFHSSFSVHFILRNDLRMQALKILHLHLNQTFS